MPKNSIRDWILDHPKLSGFGAAIALAVGFSPRVSTVASWICVSIAALFAVAMILGFAEKQRWKLSQKVITSLFAVAGLWWFGWWLTGQKKHDNANIAQNYFQAWGVENNRAWVVVDSSRLVEDRPKRLVLILRANDSTIDAKDDQQIMRSAMFEISGGTQRIEVPMSPFFIQRVLTADQAKHMLLFYLLEVSENFPVDSFHSLRDAESRGATILGAKFGYSRSIPNSGG